MNRAAFEAVASHALGRAIRLGQTSGLIRVVLEGATEVPVRGGSSRTARVRGAARLLLSEVEGEDVVARTDALELCAFVPEVANEALVELGRRLEVAYGGSARVTWALTTISTHEHAAGPEVALRALFSATGSCGRGPLKAS